RSGPTDLRGGLEHEHPAPTAGEIGSAHEAVVTATDHDGVVARAGRGVHDGRASAGCRRRSRRMVWALLAPGAPITPPPGWLLEPHMYSPRSGERYCA